MNAIKIAIFAFMFNLACGLLLLVLPNMDVESQSLLSGAQTELSDNSQYIIDGFQGNLSVTSTAEDSSTLIDRILDSMIIGKIQKVGEAIGKTLYGFVYVLDDFLRVFTPSVDAEAYITFLDYLKGILIGVLSLSYGVTIFNLWTNRNVTG